MVTVLILTHSMDGDHTVSVIRGIKQHGGSVIRLDTDKVSAGEHELLWSTSGDAVLNDTSGSHCLTNVDSVWLRRPKVFDFKVINPAQKQLTEHEFSAFLSGIYATLEDKSWLNTPQAIERAKLKTYQLKIARDIGMKTPETIITANPQVAKDFCSAGPTVFKPLAESNLGTGADTLLIPTTLMTEKHLENLDLIRNQYVLLQRCIDKDYELRVTYVNGRLFVAKQTLVVDTDPSLVDWRLFQIDGRSQYEPWSLDAELEQMILWMMRKLCLNFAALDFAVDRQGNHYFLEVNPNGQWFGYTDAIGMPAAAEVARFLVNPM